MRILLITPVTDNFSCRWMPLGPGYLSAVLKANGHEIALFDRTREFAKYNRSLESLDLTMLQKIREYQPAVVAFGTVSPAIYDTVRCAELIRQDYQGIMLAGGHHATALPWLTLEKIPELDGIILGEGEYALADVADHGRNAKAPGVLWQGRENEFPSKCQIANLDESPFPDLSIYDMDYYLARNINTIRGFYVKTISLMTSRGCRYKCGFCSESLTYGSGIRYNSPEYVLDMIEYFQKQYAFEAIYFHDSDFLSDQNRAEQICELLIKSGKHHNLKWCIQTRADALNSSIVRLLKKAGCVKIEIGIESSSQRQLNLAGKNLLLDEVVKAVQLCHETGIRVHGYFISLMPDEIITDLYQSIENIRRYRLDSFLWGNLVLIPGTKFYEQYGKKYFEEQPWDEKSIRAYYETDHVSCISPDERIAFESHWVQPLKKELHYRELLVNNNPWQVINYIINRKRADG